MNQAVATISVTEIKECIGLGSGFDGLALGTR